MSCQIGTIDPAGVSPELAERRSTAIDPARLARGLPAPAAARYLRCRRRRAPTRSTADHPPNPTASADPCRSLPPTALDRARTKAYLRLLPLLFLCYVIAYVDRANVAIVKLTMQKDLPGFDNEVFGFGMGVCFFVGYFLLEIPGTLIVEKWSARKWICRIMISWGIDGARPLTAPSVVERIALARSTYASGSCSGWPRRGSSPA